MQSISQVADISQGLVTSGRGAGARSGDWKLSIVESSHISDDGRLELEELREIEVARNTRTERHLLRPYDVLVTARAGATKVALVPPSVSRTVAGATLLVVRPRDPGSGMGHYMWYFLTSLQGSTALNARVNASATMRALAARDLGKIMLPVPSPRELDQMATLVEASEEAFSMAMEAARLRRATLRDSVIGEIAAKDSQQS